MLVLCHAMQQKKASVMLNDPSAWVLQAAHNGKRSVSTATMPADR
jgi:hypothetical protein